ncbi:P1 nuclease, putative [Babesia caballi]|uniref:P1 nuclease, putative n=1 Tax=Babesia caballi TaxID=5871 RepID=A0AAV4M0B7_BABCB|nr:P1 nuclease, putative [Babesia caballi]
MDRLRRLKVILHGHDLVDYTWWAAEVQRRIPESAPLHKQIQNDETCAAFDSSCPNGVCLIQGAKFFFAKLMNSGYQVSTMPNKFELPPFKYPKEVSFSASDSLKYLVVLLADMHYPFNVDLKEPYSRGQKKVNVSEYPMWESLCKEALGHTNPTFEEFVSKVYMPHYIHTNVDSWYGAWTNVEVLGSRYKVEQEAFNRNTWDNFEIWATETAHLNCSTLITRNDHRGDLNTVELSDPLLERLGMLIRFQIVLAGARIAIVLNYILSHREIKYCEKTGLLIVQNPKDKWTADDYKFAALMVFFACIGLACAYCIARGIRHAYRTTFKGRVETALHNWRERRKNKYKPHLDVHDN